MDAPTLFLIGPVRLIGAGEADGPTVAPKAQAMLAYLARQPDRSASRERLALLLWDAGHGRQALRQTLLVLRRRLGDQVGRVIRADPARVALAADLRTDLTLFESRLAEGRLDSACALLRGPFCDGLDAGGEGFEAWLQGERDRIAERAAEALLRLVRAAEDEGRLPDAIAAARQLVAIDPFDDAAQATLIALCRRRGLTGAARLAHRRCVGLFERELGVTPGVEVQIAARIPVPQPELVVAPPALATTGGRPGPLWHRWAAAALMLAAAVAVERWPFAPEPAEAAPAAAWVAAEEWRPGARPDTGDVPLAEAIKRGLAGDPDFAHLVPGGC